MKRIIISSIAAFLFSFNSEAQIPLPNFKSGANTLIESAVKDGIYVVNTSYFLKDKKTGQSYGRGGLKYYGTCSTLGYALPYGILCDENIFTPWEDDNAFDRYRNNENYEPVLSDSVYITNLAGEEVCRIPTTNAVSHVPDTKWIFFIETLDSLKRFHVNDVKTGKLSGWMIWICSDDEATDSSKKYSLQSNYKDIELDGIPVNVDSPFLSKGLAGGFFVIPEIEGVGDIRLNIRGVLKKDSLQWHLDPINSSWITNKEDRELEEENQALEPDNQDELTPIITKNNKK